MGSDPVAGWRGLESRKRSCGASLPLSSRRLIDPRRRIRNGRRWRALLANRLAEPARLGFGLLADVLVLRGAVERLERAVHVLESDANHGQVEPDRAVVLQRRGARIGLLAGGEVAGLVGETTERRPDLEHLRVLLGQCLELLHGARLLAGAEEREREARSHVVLLP